MTIPRPRHGTRLRRATGPPDRCGRGRQERRGKVEGKGPEVRTWTDRELEQCFFLWQVVFSFSFSSLISLGRSGALPPLMKSKSESEAPRASGPNQVLGSFLVGIGGVSFL